MGGRIRQYILDDTLGQFTGGLVLLQDDTHPHSRPDVRALDSVHKRSTLLFEEIRRVGTNLLLKPKNQLGQINHYQQLHLH
jgi:hypothetical protein